MGTNVAALAPLEAEKLINLDCDNSVWSVGANPKVYGWEIDNSANSSAVYFKVYDLDSPTVGTTAPNWCIKVPASTVLPILTNSGDGHTFTNKCSMACVAEPGTPGTTSPTSNVKVTVWTDGT